MGKDMAFRQMHVKKKNHVLSTERRVNQYNRHHQTTP